MKVCVLELRPVEGRRDEWPACHEPGCYHPSRFGIATFYEDGTLAVTPLCEHHFHNYGAKTPPYPERPVTPATWKGGTAG